MQELCDKNINVAGNFMTTKMSIFKLFDTKQEQILLFVFVTLCICLPAVFMLVAQCQYPCQNGGRCVKRNTCKCQDGWTGRYCEKGEIDGKN